MPVVLKNARVLLDGYDLSGYFNQIELTLSADMLDKTTFTTSTDGSAGRLYMGGLKHARLTGSGFWDGTPDAVLFDRIAVSDAVVSVYPEGITEGSTGAGSGYAFKAVLAEYAPGGRVGELFAFGFAAEGRGVD
jgi:hypothetical protein